MADARPPGRVYRVCATLFLAALRLFFRLRVRGVHHVPRTGACILAANHVSYLDPPIVGAPVRHRPVQFMARDSLFGYPVFRQVLPRLGVIPLRPQSGDIGALRAGVRALRAGAVLGLFPEGTRTFDGNLRPALGGIGFLVAHGKAPVVPVFIGGADRAWPRRRRLPRPLRITVTYGPPIDPALIQAAGTGAEGYARIADTVMEAIARLGGVEPAPRAADGPAGDGPNEPDASKVRGGAARSDDPGRNPTPREAEERS